MLENAISELPLVLFTTLAPLGAGAFVALAVSLLAVPLDERQSRRLDRLSFAPLAVVAAGFAASVAHLASPGNAFHVLNNLGASPLSNEIAAGGVFFVAALAYCVLAVFGRLKGAARKAGAVVVAVLALVFVLFVGCAYLIETIASWNHPATPVTLLGYALLGGCVGGTLLTRIALGIGAAVPPARFRVVMGGLGAVGAACAIGGLLTQGALTNTLHASITAGSALVDAAVPLTGIAVAGLALAMATHLVSLGVSWGVYASAVSLVVAAAATFLGRMVFYALQLNIGL
ncbi:MAG: dimethyl sulfoxide reductase anchor subunit [Coriobacteriales bacterium]|jgi:anaerobic dimethyl sulfoxide reductase subunit C (anchor subunit)/Tat-targeted selenate reductase subunit YnfH|nr:dimethyl sulfoxide reductase anchor subunit [Coriobacteriales bacterium]